MKLESFRVTCYKNVLDSTEVSVEPEVTVLVGVNESIHVGDGNVMGVRKIFLKLHLLRRNLLLRRKILRN